MSGTTNRPPRRGIGVAPDLSPETPGYTARGSDDAPAGRGDDMHRGRIQVQGSDLGQDLSWSWATPDPPTAAAALEALDGLRSQLPSGALALRGEAFERAARFVRDAAASGGVSAPVSVTFQNRGLSRTNRTARVDIEVRTGRAFVK